MWTMSPIEVAIFDLEGGVSVGAAESGRQGALSCATRQGGLLLDGADGDPDLVRHQGGGQDSDGGNQASDGLVGHDIPSVSPSGERRQGALILEPSTRPRYRVSGLATERAAFKARSLAASACLMSSANGTSACSASRVRRIHRPRWATRSTPGTATSK
jgi:hypothetical protein